MTDVTADADAARAPVLAVRDLTITFPPLRRGGGSVKVLDALNLEVHDGEFVAVLGPSGCGKSTLLRALGGLLDPRARGVGRDRRAARRRGSPRHRVDASTRRVCLPWRRALSNAMVGAIAAGVPRERALPRAQRLFDEFGLGGFERAWPHELSGGMRQRLALLRTCLAERPVLLLDEPFGGLDPVTRRRMNTWLASVDLTAHTAAADGASSGAEASRATGSGVVLVTHDIDEAIDARRPHRGAVGQARPDRARGAGAPRTREPL